MKKISILLFMGIVAPAYSFGAAPLVRRAAQINMPLNLCRTYAHPSGVPPIPGIRPGGLVAAVGAFGGGALVGFALREKANAQPAEPETRNKKSGKPADPSNW
jgi:hypothetical protein